MRSFDSKKFINRSSVFLKKTLSKNGFSKVLVAVSGGIDSAVTLSLAVKAVGALNVYAVLLPHGRLNPQGLTNAQELVKKLKIPKTNVFKINIEPIIEKLVEVVGETENLRKGNLMARVRMIILYDVAKKNHALVLGTENKSEHLLGYFTRFGDSASDVELIRGLYKTEVYKLVSCLKIPELIRKAKPTAGLWPDQTDEGDFGFSYAEADEILYFLFEKRLTKEKIVGLGYKKETVEKVSERVRKNDFKHKTPYVFHPFNSDGKQI